LTFKENVPDIRNSKVPDIVTELREFGIRADVADPMADPAMVAEEFDLTLRSRSELRDLDALVLATPHTEFVQHWVELERLLRPRGVVIDVKSALPGAHRSDITYWSL
jgi:UDP-N-acetyl-D-galactosamine dehydrogenase